MHTVTDNSADVSICLTKSQSVTSFVLVLKIQLIILKYKDGLAYLKKRIVDIYFFPTSLGW